MDFDQQATEITSSQIHEKNANDGLKIKLHAYIIIDVPSSHVNSVFDSCSSKHEPYNGEYILFFNEKILIVWKSYFCNYWISYNLIAVDGTIRECWYAVPKF